METRVLAGEYGYDYYAEYKGISVDMLSRNWGLL